MNDILGVTIASTNVPGFDNSDITISEDGNSIFLNFAGLTVADASQIVLNVQFQDVIIGA